MVASRSVIALTCVFGLVFTTILVFILRFVVALTFELVYIEQQKVALENCAKVVEPGRWIEITYCREAVQDFRHSKK